MSMKLFHVCIQMYLITEARFWSGSGNIVVLIKMPVLVAMITDG